MADEQEASAADADDVSESEVDEADTSGIQTGDFVRLDFTARTVEDGQLVDTTDPEVAEEEGVADQDQSFEPRVIIVGDGHLFEQVESDLEGKEAGDTGSVVVPSDEAFGAHDPDDVRTISAEKIPEDDRYPGAHVDIDGEHGHVEAVIGGRARVDFNHPLAGDDIEYEYEIIEQVEDRIEKARGLFDAYLGIDLEMFIETDEVEETQLIESDDDDDEDAEPEYETVTTEKETLYVESTPELTMNQQWMFSKQQIVQDVIEHADVNRVIVREVLDGAAAGPMGGMMGGLGGELDADVEDALEDADVDADELVEELSEE
ncbi:peptidylprolyl isomerase [Salinarchaeum sp. IM2453]|uniref:FKBP-type peptidyl-prolyl cis-trans isomerase n=1 Tax=Salinarchaeum sp. IM2453 TaxID=2862870 RepID=UPI001C8394DB|nr:peptidylprolyl isomerase [Salinarchaeum sp. IM2453]QZA88866.1 peptidylprolyl isomerase [Salinarchaeum sp. IM2453]